MSEHDWTDKRVNILHHTGHYGGPVWMPKVTTARICGRCGVNEGAAAFFGWTCAAPTDTEAST